MSDVDLRVRIKEMLVKNLMLQTTPDQIGDDLPLFGPDGLGLDSIDALELGVALRKVYGLKIESVTEEVKQHFINVRSLSRFIRSQQVD